MRPMILLPTHDAREPVSPRQQQAGRDVLIGIVVVCLCIAGVTGAFVATGLLQKPPTQPQTELAPMGQPLTIDNVTVTLTSAVAMTATQPATPSAEEPTPALRGLTLSLHLWNHTAHNQSVSTAGWQLLDQGGNVYLLIPQGHLPASLAPNVTVDLQLFAPISAGGANPFTLQTGPIAPDWYTLGWQFNA